MPQNRSAIGWKLRSARCAAKSYGKKSCGPKAALIFNNDKQMIAQHQQLLLPIVWFDRSVFYKKNVCWLLWTFIAKFYFVSKATWREKRVSWFFVDVSKSRITWLQNAFLFDVRKSFTFYRFGKKRKKALADTLFRFLFGGILILVLVIFLSPRTFFAPVVLVGVEKIQAENSWRFLWFLF